MNERIQELAEQAWIETSYPESCRVIREWSKEKFAELIVRECIDVIGEENYTMLTGKAYCTKLKRHFGVEE